MAETRQWQDHKGFVLDSVKDFDVIECETCGFKHIVPIPNEEELDKFYRTRYYTEIKPDYAELHRRDAEWWGMVYNERYGRFEKHLKYVGRILDVGCGPGFFLKVGQGRGWNGVGIEPSLQAANYAQSLGLKVVVDSFNHCIQKDLGLFDVIQINQVIEHLPSPIKAVDICFDMLRPGGLLCIIAANDYNPFQQILRKYLDFEPWWIVPPEHINYFGPDSLEKLLVSRGFEFVSLTATFPIDMFLLMGDNYVGNADVGRACHARRKNFEFALTRSGYAELKVQLYEAFSRLNIGREVEIIVRKPS